MLTLFEQVEEDQYLGKQLLSVLQKIQRHESLSDEEFIKFREMLDKYK